jgi:hypothetical protein
MSSVVTTWGSTPAERADFFPCDEILADPEVVCWRAVDIAAPAEVTFRWLCQLRVAPYSYDWIDNLGRRSPRELTPGLDRLEAGQRFMTMFVLAGFEPGRSLTLRHAGRLWGRLAVTYRASPAGEDRSRLAVKLLARFPRRSPLWLPFRALLPAGDLVMMRRQLLNLKELAERSASELVG